MIKLLQFNLKEIVSDRVIATLLMVMLCVQIFPLEGEGVSNVKVAIMALAPILFIFKTPVVSKSLLWGVILWLTCYFCASFQSYMRFSTIGYFGMYIMTFIVFYNLVYQGAFTFSYFKRLLRALIVVFAIVLILQQICILLGIRTFWLINLDNQYFLAIDKLPSLTIEPSHSARVLGVMMLCYLRCLQMENGGERVSIKTLFDKDNRKVSTLFPWVMLTMGSGTAFIALGILCLYFITWRNIWYVAPILIGFFAISSLLEVKQLTRAVDTMQATMTGDKQQVLEADESAAVRILPVFNTFTETDLTDKETWFGKGTSKKYSLEEAGRLLKKSKIPIFEQYGLIAMILSFILVYTCMIKNVLSIETLMFGMLFAFSIGNIYYIWGCMMIFSATRYFLINTKQTCLKTKADC